MDNKDNPNPHEYDATRRRLVKAGLYIAGGGILGAIAGRALNTSTSSATEAPAPATTPVATKETPTTNATTKEVPKTVEKTDLKAFLNEILSLDPYTPKRVRKEAAYVALAQTKEQINQGFWAVTSKDLRACLLDARTELRTKGDLPKNLSPQEMEWAISQKLQPEVLAICKEAYPQALEVIKTLLPTLRPSLANQKIDPETVMMNPGGMAMLMALETGSSFGGNELKFGFINTGEQPAIRHINPKIFPDGVDSLKKLCELVSTDTGINFNYEKIPGSYSGEGDVSGGAIGPQFMPDNALKVYQLMDRVGVKFNPFDPTSAVIGAWVFLAMKGYMRGNDQTIFNTIMSWNYDKNEANKTIAAANDYWDKFVRVNSNAVALAPTR